MAKDDGFSAEERAAMKERAAELKKQKAGGRGAAKAAKQAEEVVARIAEMGDADRAIAEPLHALITEVAPELAPRTWYGMPAYARNDKILCFFQGSEKFSTRYCTLGFNDIATLDDGSMWPSAYALTEWTDDVAARVREIITRAIG